MTETLIHETAAPWYIRQAEFDGIRITLTDHALPSCDAYPPFLGREVAGRFTVGWAIEWSFCPECSYWHLIVTGSRAERVYEGDSLEEAEAAYAELERQLLAGELGGRDGI